MVTLRYSLRRVSPLDSVNGGTHNPKVGGSNPPPATKQVPDYKRLPSQPEGVSVVLAHNLLTEFRPQTSHLHDPPLCLVRGRGTKQVVELLHYPAVVIPDQVRVAHRCSRADVSETLLSYFHRSMQAVLGGGIPMPMPCGNPVSV